MEGEASACEQDGTRSPASLRGVISRAGRTQVGPRLLGCAERWASLVRSFSSEVGRLPSVVTSGCCSV